MNLFYIKYKMNKKQLHKIKYSLYCVKYKDAETAKKTIIKKLKSGNVNNVI